VSASRIDHLRLARTEGVGPVTYRRLLRHFASAAAAIAALPGLARAGGRSSDPSVVSAHAAEREIEALERLGGTMLFADDSGYPPLLGLLADPPPVISVLGDVSVLSVPTCVGLVGARNASANGQRIAETLAADLAMQSIVVVSGMARGVDAAAHEGALSAGRTVAAVAGGLDQPYPQEHAGLQARIAAGGAVVSEAPLGTAPQARHFPRRNRIIAGLSLGVVVVEAAPRSGSLITARLALEAGRELFAVPGSPLDPRCRGSNDLIRQGAHLTETAEDVVLNLPDHPGREGLARSPMFRHMGQGMEEEGPGFEGRPNDVKRAQVEVLWLLSASPTSVDELLRRSHFAPSAVMAALMQLELALRIEFLPGNAVCLVA
jgi:DNA processing protein